MQILRLQIQLLPLNRIRITSRATLEHKIVPKFTYDSAGVILCAVVGGAAMRIAADCHMRQ